MARRYAIRKCPNCCPDGGAIVDYTFDENDRPTWTCRNCLREFPRIVRTRNTVETDCQRQIVAEMERRGYRADRREMIGMNLFIVLVKGKGLLDERLIGTIGPRGKIEMTNYYFGGQRELSSLAYVY